MKNILQFFANVKNRMRVKTFWYSEDGGNYMSGTYLPKSFIKNVNQLYLQKLKKIIYCPEFIFCIPHPVSVWQNV